MIPQPRPGSVLPPPPPLSRRQAGVLILLYPIDRVLHLVLTRRTETVATHKGQISFPGGMREGQETLAEAALREAREELGLEHTTIELLGEPLTPIYIPVSDFWVTAFAGYTRERPLFQVQPDEVGEVIQVPLADLLDDSNVREEDWMIRGGMPARVPYFWLGGQKVWGATAMMLSEFKEILNTISGV